MDFICSLGKGVMTNVITATIPNMRKTNNPYIGRVKKMTSYVAVALATSYENGIHTAQEKSGVTADFKAENKSYMHYINDFVLALNSDESKLYLKMQWSQKMLSNGVTKIESYYIVDGRLATEAEVKEIKSFIPDKKPSQKQLDNGVKLEEIRYYTTTSLDNVLAIKQGSAVWDELGLLK